MTQLFLDLIPHKVEGEIINQRASDGYINATAMCKSVGKSISDYSRLKTTNEFLNELSSDTGIPISLLIHSIRGGQSSSQGTWVHPDVAVNLGQWLSPKFAVKVSRWVRDWAFGGKRPSAELPVHIKRYLANRGHIPHTHMNILTVELVMRVYTPTNISQILDNTSMRLGYQNTHLNILKPVTLRP